MDLQTILTVVDSWPLEDRLRLMEAIWDQLNEQGHEPELTEEFKAELDRRLAELDADPDIATTWEEIKAYVRRPR